LHAHGCGLGEGLERVGGVDDVFEVVDCSVDVGCLQGFVLGGGRVVDFLVGGVFAEGAGKGGVSGVLTSRLCAFWYFWGRRECGFSKGRDGNWKEKLKTETYLESM
jgi:hypothetical protein